MRQIGYIIYQFWDMLIVSNGIEEIHTGSPIPEFKKRIYTDLASAKEAVEQMKKHQSENCRNESMSYHILPISTPQEDYMKMVEAYRERRLENQKNNELQNKKY